MAVLAAAQLLDELMGRNRNIAPNEKGKELNWEDPEVSFTLWVRYRLFGNFVTSLSWRTRRYFFYT